MQITVIINTLLLLICVPITAYICFRASAVIVHGALTYLFPSKTITVTLKGPHGIVKKQFSASSHKELVNAILEDRVVSNEAQ